MNAEPLMQKVAQMGLSESKNVTWYRVRLFGHHWAALLAECYASL